MIVNCPKCGKEIVEADIEERKIYCCSCMEWFTTIADIAENSPEKENTKRMRHKIVTVWLWMSIIANALYVLFILINRVIETSKQGAFLVSFTIAIIIGQILVLNWKIVGFFNNIVAFAIAFYVMMIVSDYYKPFIALLLIILTLSINFGILNIRKNGISTWRHLLNEAKANKRKTKIWFAAVFGSVFMALVISAFPVKIIYGNIIVLFSPKRIADTKDYNGIVLGNHVLKTEFGEIKIGSHSYVSMSKDELSIGLYYQSDRITHNLVIAGIKIPNDSILVINIGNKHTEIAGVGIEFRHIFNISGISFTQAQPTFMQTNKDALTIPAKFEDEYITLSDSTVINVINFTGDFSIAEEKWELIDTGRWFFRSLWVKLSGETEFARYSSVSFEPNWGAFIKGDLFK